MAREPKLVPGRDTTLEQIRPSEMNVDFAYQRDPKRRRTKIRLIGEKYDRRLLGVFHVVRRKDGSIWVLDGAGRKLVMERVGDDEPVTCVVHHHVQTVEQEADWFLRLNPDEVAKVTPSQKFRARLISNDPEAILMNAEAQKGGLTIGGIGKNGISVQTAGALLAMGNLARVGFIKKAGWETYKPTGIQYIALGAMMLACPNIHEGRLRQILRENPPNVLHAAAMAEYGAGQLNHARETGPRMARALLKIYNHHASAHRVQANWKRVDVAMEHHYDQWRPMID